MCAVMTDYKTFTSHYTIKFLLKYNSRMKPFAPTMKD